MTPEDLLAEELGRPRHSAIESEIGFHQGKVIAFNLDTGANTIRVKDVDFFDLPVMNVTDSAGLLPGMVVGILRIRSTYFVLGRIANPGSAQFGDITVRAESGSRLNLSDGQISFLRGSQLPNQSQGVITAQGSGGRVWLELTPPYTRGSSGENKIFLEGSNDELTNGLLTLVTGGQGSFNIGGNGYITTGNDLTLDALGTLTINGNGVVTILSDTTLDLRSVINDVRITHTTASLQPLARISDGNNRVYRDTSIRAAKLDIEDLEIEAEDILKLRPRVWRDKAEAEENPDVVRRGAGFVAEEVDEIPGMEPFLYRDPKGNLTALAYDKFPAALIVVDQYQQRQIEELRSMVKELAAQVSALKGGSDAVRDSRGHIGHGAQAVSGPGN